MAAGTLDNINIYTTTPAPSNNTNATNAPTNATSASNSTANTNGTRRGGVEEDVVSGESEVGVETSDGSEFRRNAGDKLQQFWWNKVSKKWECVDSNTYDSVKLTLSG